MNKIFKKMRSKYDWFLCWAEGSKEVDLHGSFTAKELRTIAAFMEKKRK